LVDGVGLGNKADGAANTNAALIDGHGLSPDDWFLSRNGGEDASGLNLFDDIYCEVETRPRRITHPDFGLAIGGRALWQRFA